jgi:NCAIR mutase (PurE)-related protein
MNPERLREVLERLAGGSMGVDAALEELKAPAVEDLGFARVDTHRSLRCGFPEVVFCEGKPPEQAAEIAKVIVERCGRVLTTRADEATREAIREAVSGAASGIEIEESAVARAVRAGSVPERESAGEILVICAGTSDIPVAEEAAFTARAMGSPVRTLYDVGVAGIHRLMDQYEAVRKANVLVVAAGMEGALASVVGGIVDRPVIAVPTSVGYGASFGGLAALLAMLNSCASNVAVVNIDNGFGAGYVATLINTINTVNAAEKAGEAGETSPVDHA